MRGSESEGTNPRGPDRRVRPVSPPAVPTGSIALEVFYTGLDTQVLAVNVPAGGVVTRDVSLSNASLYASQDPTVKLDAFTVAASKDTDGSSIAINDQRFAPNIKNVVSTDAHGEVMGGNIERVLKFVPGIDTGGGAFEPGGISVRGFDASMTLVTNERRPDGELGRRPHVVTLEQD